MSATAEHARIESRQMPLFPRDSREVSAELHLPWPEVSKLHGDGLLSFNPESCGALDESREAELVFLGAMVANGCSHSMLRQLLTGLRKPYSYDVARLFFAWHTRQWQLLPGEDDPEAAFFSLLERLSERRSIDVLMRIRDWLDEALDLAQNRTHMFSHGSSRATNCFGREAGRKSERE
jgi:hypothetical protein